jgi:hypothetical protein
MGEERRSEGKAEARKRIGAEAWAGHAYSPHGLAAPDAPAKRYKKKAALQL